MSVDILRIYISKKSKVTALVEFTFEGFKGPGFASQLYSET
jgi:hypothetical protein